MTSDVAIAGVSGDSAAEGSCDPIQRMSVLHTPIVKVSRHLQIRNSPSSQFQDQSYSKLANEGFYYYLLVNVFMERPERRIFMLAVLVCLIAEYTCVSDHV
jgi:hypothetical protein